MSIKSTIWSLFSIKHYKCVLLKNGIVIDKIYRRVTNTAFILHRISEKNVAYIIPSKEDMIIDKHSFNFFNDIDNAIPFSISKSIPEITAHQLESRKITTFKKYIVRPITGDTKITHIGNALQIGIDFLPSSLIGKWLSGETVDMLMEAPREKSVFGDKLWLYVIGAVVAIIFVYFVFGR